MTVSPVELERLTDQCAAAGVLNLFQELIDLGNSPRFAAMLALQEPPGARYTDRAFNEAQRRKMEGMGPLAGKLLHDTARQAGIDTRGKYYMSGLGRANDPAAWVTSSDDVLTVAKARNLDLEGSLRRKSEDRGELQNPDTALAPDLVREFTNKALAADPALAAKVKNNPKAQRELREAIVEKHGKKKRVKRPRRFKRPGQ